MPTKLNKPAKPILAMVQMERTQAITLIPTAVQLYPQTINKVATSKETTAISKDKAISKGATAISKPTNKASSMALP